MTNSSSSTVSFFPPFVIWVCIVIVFSCVSWAKISGAENGEINDGNNT